MSSQQVTFGEPKRVRGREYRTASDGTEWVRRIYSDDTTTEWEQYIPNTPVQAAPRLCLWLVRESQPTGPYHWLLAVAREEGGDGHVYQVKGDAIYMYYSHSVDADAFKSDSYFDSYNLAYLDDNGPAQVADVVNSQPPPRAENAASITENCQGWTVRVLEELAAQKVVPSSAIDKVRVMMEPLS